MHRPGDPRQTAVSDLSKVIADLFLNLSFYFNTLKHFSLKNYNWKTKTPIELDMDLSLTNFLISLCYSFIWHDSNWIMFQIRIIIITFVQKQIQLLYLWIKTKQRTNKKILLQIKQKKIYIQQTSFVVSLLFYFNKRNKFIVSFVSLLIWPE